MVTLSMHCGLRRGELFGLTWENVDLKNNTITVEGATSKRLTTRHVALNATAKATLKDWKPKDATGLVFPSRAGKFWTVKRSRGRALLRRAEITGFRWHDMRHDFACGSSWAASISTPSASCSATIASRRRSATRT